MTAGNFSRNHSDGLSGTHIARNNTKSKINL